MAEHRVTTSRIEAFSAGVVAVLITIMVVELRAPVDVTWQARWTSGEGARVRIGICGRNRNRVRHASNLATGGCRRGDDVARSRSPHRAGAPRRLSPNGQECTCPL